MQVEDALEAVNGSLMPSLSRLLDGVIDSAALAVPGKDAAQYAEALSRTAWDVAALTELVAAVAPLAQGASEPPRMSA